MKKINKTVNSSRRVILGVTGSIAAYKSADIIRRLRDKGFEVSVVMTKESECFITPLTLSSLSGNPVCRGGFSSEDAEGYITHIRLAQKADALLIAPATANIIGKLAGGIADDVLTCCVLATNAPIFIAPAMNTNMYENQIVMDNCSKLKKRGMTFIGPVEGKLACGDKGKGHLVEVEDIVQTVVTAVG